MLNTALHQSSGWRAAHDALTRLARDRAGLDFQEGRQLRTAQQARVHERLGYGSFAEYIERLFGYSPRLTFEKLRVAEALESLPRLSEALRDGNTSWSSVRELTRVATRATESAWLHAARGHTVRDVEKLVSGHRLGDLPSDAKNWRAQRHVLRFEISSEVLALFREALAKLRRDAGGPLDDDSALLLMARHVLGGPADDGRASYQVAVTVCEECARATQTGGGDAIDISAGIAEMANCDAQQLIRFPMNQQPAGAMRRKRASQAIPPATRRAVLRRDRHRCRVPGCRHATFVDVHHLRTREDGGGHELSNLLTLCGAHHRACHRGHLRIERSDSGFRFLHAGGTPYGEPLDLGAPDVAARAFRALLKLGFDEREARAAITSSHVGSHDGVEALVRSALERLTRHAFAKAA